MNSTVTSDATLEWIDDRLQSAAYCTSATIPGDELRAILSLARAAKAYRVSGLEGVETLARNDIVTVTGPQLRLLLMLARQTKRSMLNCGQMESGEGLRR